MGKNVNMDTRKQKKKTLNYFNIKIPYFMHKKQQIIIKQGKKIGFSVNLKLLIKK